DPSTGGTTTGTLTFNSAYQSPYSQLYVVGTTGSGSGVINYTVNFSDATTQTGALNFPDWALSLSTASSIRALGGIGRITRGNPGSFDAAGSNTFNLWEAPVNIIAANQNKIISNINFTWSSSSSSTSSRTSLFAVTGYTSTTSGIRVNDGTSSSATPAVGVTSSAPSNIFCSGETVTFTANPTNEGSSPTYQWKLAGVNISGATSPTYTTSSLANGNQISVTLTSNLACKTSPTATSPAVPMTLGIVSPVVTASASNNGICSGTNVLFNATPTNGGSSPSYQWKLGGVNIPGATSPTYSSSSFSNGDLVTVVLTSSIGCATANPATSSAVTMNVTTTLSPTVVISSAPLVPRNGSAVTFSATITNGGASPSYQWYKNGSIIIGATSSSYFVASALLADQYSLKLISSSACLAAPAVMSNYISVITTLPVLIESFNLSVNTNNVLLTWVTSDESGNKDFIIERAISPFSQFEKIGSVAATNLNTGSSYQFTDKGVAPGMYQYKLIQEDVDGTQAIIGIKPANIIGGNIWSVSDLQSGWQIKSQLPLTYQLMDLDGRILESGSVNGSKIIIKPLANSIYLMKIICNGQTQIQKLIK
ncbi:MAG TPA: T9SS type A sorting domain-containing protein, partial [Puia sp.]|nr:T9SS type A sorting domain-containing protein [Puia sp.]